MTIGPRRGSAARPPSSVTVMTPVPTVTAAPTARPATTPEGRVQRPGPTPDRPSWGILGLPFQANRPPVPLGAASISISAFPPPPRGRQGRVGP